MCEEPKGDLKTCVRRASASWMRDAELHGLEDGDIQPQSKHAWKEYSRAGFGFGDTIALGTIALEVDPLTSGFPGRFGVCIVPCYNTRRIGGSQESPVDTSLCSSHGPHTDLTRGKLLPAQHSPTTHFQCKTRRGAKIADKMPRMLWAVPPV